MTYAPDTIRAARALLLASLDMHPTSHAYPADLDPDEVGIAGDTAHAVKGTSYHLGKDQLAAGAYSTRTARDKAGLTDAASAIDIGEFSVTTPLGTFNLRHLTGWLFTECRKSAPDTLDLREVIGTLDGKTVLRWDAERGRSSAPRAGEADSSHLFHTHGSWYRDSEFRLKTPLFERYLREIGLLEDDMDQKDKLAFPTSNPDRVVGQALADQANERDWGYALPGEKTTNPPKTGSRLDIMFQAAQKTVNETPAEQVPVDVDAFVDAVVAKLSPLLEAAAERAVRRVLGAVDGATPAGQA